MQTNASPQIDHDEIDSRRSMKCAISVNNGPIIGSPIVLFPGYAIKLAIDGGRSGEPSIGLRIRVAKGSKHIQIYELQNQDIDWTSVGWYPGTQVNGQYMLEDFHAGATIIHEINPDVFKHCSAGQLQNLMCIKISSRSSVIGPFQETAWQGLERNVQAVLRAVLATKEHYWLTIWFLADPSITILEQKCTTYFRDAFVRRQPYANVTVGASALPLPRWQMEYLHNGISIAWKAFEEKQGFHWRAFERKNKEDMKIFPLENEGRTESL